MSARVLLLIALRRHGNRAKSQRASSRASRAHASAKMRGSCAASSGNFATSTRYATISWFFVQSAKESGHSSSASGLPATALTAKSARTVSRCPFMMAAARGVTPAIAVLTTSGPRRAAR
eukprot:Amastigsp_a4922_2.p2 type:complete len:120 gc:universal Amastigsp_a4922_2:1017-658(-)